jgi:hypothetical protein
VNAATLSTPTASAFIDRADDPPHPTTSETTMNAARAAAGWLADPRMNAI